MTNNLFQGLQAPSTTSTKRNTWISTKWK